MQRRGYAAWLEDRYQLDVGLGYDVSLNLLEAYGHGYLWPLSFTAWHIKRINDIVAG